MKLAPRMILLLIPVFLTPFVLLTVTAVSNAGEGIRAVATSLLQFKSSELLRFAAGEVQLLEANGLSDTPEYVAAAKKSVENFAGSLVRSPTEMIAAVDRDGAMQFSTGAIEVREDEGSEIRNLASASRPGWTTLQIGGISRVADLRYFEPWGWVFFVTETRQAFFRSIDRIALESGIVAGVSIVAVLALIIIISKLITRPLLTITQAMRKIIASGDLSQSVAVVYSDEIGELGDNFNTMTTALNQAYGEIKNYALQTAVAKKREMNIRNIFQKYVPKQVIAQFFASPDSMLVGEERELAILFSDIRDFTALSESMTSHEIVGSLNSFFDIMVEKIMHRQGLVDKYIGDAIMAIFGAPSRDPDCAYHAVLAALDMLDGLAEFNTHQVEKGRKLVDIGIGINFGSVTVGNIGTERKMEYTVIGDRVNTASRLEGLTKFYHQPILISDTIHERLKGRVPCRFVDKVVPKGKSEIIPIYAVKRSLAEQEAEAWRIHEAAVSRYFDRDFTGSLDLFSQAAELLPQDFIIQNYIFRCRGLKQAPPPPEWTGAVVFDAK